MAGKAETRIVNGRAVTLTADEALTFDVEDSISAYSDDLAQALRMVAATLMDEIVSLRARVSALEAGR